ncbi:MAG: phospholipase [Gemmatimonadaceae bacterium]
MTDINAFRPLTRRRFATYLAAIVSSPSLFSCHDLRGETTGGSARLQARPAAPTGTVSTGLRALGLASGRDGFLYVPTGYAPSTPAPLLLTLHGATMESAYGISLWRDLADEHGVIVLSPDSRSVTWDGIRGRFSEDIAFIDRALRLVFRDCQVDPQRMVVHGFSDGATYGLGLGLANGDLFGRVVASSPGFVAASDSPNVGRPRFFISHGRQDGILPIAQTSARIVPELRSRGYTVEYREFNGGHGVPPDIAKASMDWMLSP